MAKVFVNFRNGDDPYAAALVFRGLARCFGESALFRSSESIPPGSRWAETIWAAHRESAVLIAVIGPRWLTIAARPGEPRLYQPGDWVHDEIAAALDAGKLVIPVLLEGVPRFSADALPAALAPLAALQTVPMDHRRIDETIAALAKRISPLIGAGEPGGPGDSAVPAAQPWQTAQSAPADSPAPTTTRGRTQWAASGFPDTDPDPADAPQPPADADWLTVWNIPPTNPAFLDRADLLQTVRAAVAGSGGMRPVVLHGGVGVGKTQLAAEYAYRYAGDYRLAWWVSADRPETVPAQLAVLAGECGFDDGRDLTAALPALFGRLRRQGRWLLVFDGVDDPRTLAPYLAAIGAGGDVLVTSRNPDWGQMSAACHRIDCFDRAESVRLLATGLGGVSPEDLDRLASALDDIPLAVAQAAAFLADAPLSVPEYTALLRSRADELLSRGETYVYPGSLAAAWSLGLERLERLDQRKRLAGQENPAAAADDPELLDPAAAAVDLVEFLSVFAAAPLPFDVLKAGGPQLPPALARAVSDPLGFSDTTRILASTGLIRIDRSGFHPHGLFQAFVRNRIGAVHREILLESARRALADVARGDPRDPESWAGYAEHLPHVLAVDPAASPAADCAWHLLDVIHYLVVRGDAATARDLAAPALLRWRAEQGPDSRPALGAAARLAQASFRLGEYDVAVALDEDVLAACRRLAGDDDPQTLTAAHNLAMDRWAADLDRPAAADLFRSVADRRCKALGADHPDTLRSVHNLALAFRAQGDYDRALTLDEDNRRRLTFALGEGHPDTLRSAYATALDLRALGESADALPLEVATYNKSREILGADHPDTLRAGYSLAAGLRVAGEYDRARVLAEEICARFTGRLGDTHVDSARCRFLLGTLLCECGETEAGQRIRAAAESILLGLARRIDA